MIYQRCAKFFCLLGFIVSLFSQSVFAQSTVHVVVRGDTIYSISRSYKVDQEELMRANGITDASRIQAGMRLTIPSKAPAAAPAVPVHPPVGGQSSEYIVQQNDTLYSIARIRGITLQALRDINGFSKDYVIKTGQKIKIPGASAPAASIARPVRPEPPEAKPRTASPSIRWPVTAKEILYMTGKLSGVLVTGERSESIKSLTRGTVITAGPYRGYGNIAIIEAEGGYLYFYGSCESLSVRQGDRIEPGTELGKLGIYPASGKPDLVFMVYQNDSPVDPAKAPRA